MKLSDDIEASILLLNNSPIDDFQGLSPIEVDHLIYNTYGEKSPLKFRDNIEDKTLDQIPLFRVAEEFLKIIHRDKQITLTPLGALPKKVLVEVYDKQFLLDEHIELGISKLSKEDNCIAIQNARLTAELAGFVRKSKGKLYLTKIAIKLLETNNRSQIFTKFFQAFTDKFLWSFNDGFPEDNVGQFGWAFSIILLEKFGEHPQTVDFYANKYLRAFPNFISFFQHGGYAIPEKYFSICYGVRTFSRFFLWFGFVTLNDQKIFLTKDSDTLTRTEIVKSIFKIDY